MSTRPEVIYRYRPFHSEYLAKEIRDGEIFFCRLDSFNDPYEGRLRMNLRLDHEACVAVVKSLVTAPDPSPRDRQILGPERMFVLDRLTKLARAMSPEELHRTAAMLAALGDPGHFVGGLNTIHEPMRQNTVVACFSELKNDPVMFAHYAGVHKGVCLQYETGQAREFFPVRYADRIPEFSAEQISGGVDRIARDFALTKSSHWRSEREWRIIYFPAPQASLRTHGMNLVRVFIGVGATRESRDQIKEWCRSSRYPHVSVHELELSEAGYEIIEA